MALGQMEAAGRLVGIAGLLEESRGERVILRYRDSSPVKPPETDATRGRLRVTGTPEE
jgi:hypothetical protein